VPKHLKRRASAIGLPAGPPNYDQVLTPARILGLRRRGVSGVVLGRLFLETTHREDESPPSHAGWSTPTRNTGVRTYLQSPRADRAQRASQPHVPSQGREALEYVTSPPPPLDRAISEFNSPPGPRPRPERQGYWRSEFAPESAKIFRLQACGTGVRFWRTYPSSTIPSDGTPVWPPPGSCWDALTVGLLRMYSALQKRGSNAHDLSLADFMFSSGFPIGGYPMLNVEGDGDKCTRMTCEPQPFLVPTICRFRHGLTLFDTRASGLAQEDMSS